MNTKEVARTLGISYNSLQQFLAKRTALLPTQRRGNNYIWTEADIERLKTARAKVAKPGATWRRLYGNGGKR